MIPSWIKKLNSPLIEKAYVFAKNAHYNQKRKNGEDFINHPLRVAYNVYKWGLDEQTIAAALLHDVVEDTSYSMKDIEKAFDPEISFLVDGVTKIDNIKYTKNAENLRKFIVYFSKDLRVLIIKIADRLHNIQTLNALPPDKQYKIAKETIEIYAPLAYRLGMQQLAGELEDLSFPYVEPKIYQWLITNVKETYKEREKYAKKLIPLVQHLLIQNNIHPIVVEARAKHYYSLYKKLQRYDMNIDNIYDLVALRIIVNTVEECYAALGVIHQKWNPLPGRFKDYIARPKLNGYQSLHTTVFCEDNKITEIQIKTEQMHKNNELGIAAHWAYEQIKDNKTKQKIWKANNQDLTWVQQLRLWYQKFNNNDFLKFITTDLFKDRIFVITPNNDVIDLPSGSTPIDFAYKIHSEIGNQCVGAKVNGKIVPLNYELQTGDIVEILTQKGKKPSAAWLQIAKTINAKHHIKKILNINNINLKSKGQEIEFHIININKPGYLQKITTYFSKQKINITYLNSKTDNRKKFSHVVIRCSKLEKPVIENILFNIKKIPETKEISYKIIR
ncbi:MAG: RelA/SpoT family protein [Minisyncoccia bacterium]